MKKIIYIGLTQTILLIAGIAFYFVNTENCITNVENSHHNPSNVLFLINVSNYEDIYEFKYHSSSNSIEKIYHCEVKQTGKDESLYTKSFSPDFLEKYTVKMNNRKSLIRKYSKGFSLDEYSAAEISLDGKYIAYTLPFDQKVIYVASLQENKTLFSIQSSEDQYIDDFDWANYTLGVIKVHSRWGYLPWELLAFLMGHPIPHNTIYLELYSLQGNLVQAVPVLKNITYGEGRLAK